MAYFPQGGRDADVQEADSLARLFGASKPGYGLYTYILAAPETSLSPQALDTYRELLRVIETYVLAAGDGGTGPDAHAHTFLVPVRPERHGVALVDQTGPELSAPMRETLVRHLRERGQEGLARQLERSPGPFLVTSLAPSLTPKDPAAPQLVVDLGAVGPAYMYSVVDAYDRPIPDDQAGRPDSLSAVRERLRELFPEQVLADEADDRAPPGEWVFLLGSRQVAGLGPGAASAAAPTPTPETDGDR
jgi:hypothetical protein